MRAHILTVALTLFAAACSYAPLRPVPEPLPAALPWQGGGAPVSGAFMGVEVRENDSGSLDELYFDPGVRVTRVVRNSPAEAAGLAIGDVIQRFDGALVDDPDSLDALLRQAEAGQPARLEVLRDDTVFEVRLELAAASGGGAEVRPLYQLDPARSRAGWATAERGVVLVSAAPGGPVEHAGLPLGTVVLAVDGEEVHSARALVRQLGARPPGAEVRLMLLDADGGTRETRLRLQSQGRRLTGAGLPILFHYDADPNGHGASFALLDLWLISLYSYEREGKEKEWRILRFIRWSTGVGELAE